jgi:predicted TIM-barrel fold metal-dependent hydrolase
MQFEIEEALFDLIFSGVLERFPELKIISVENEYSWLAPMLVRMDKGYERFRREFPISLTMRPSEYVHRQVRVTFFNDAIGPLTLPFLGTDLLMWSSDYPHQNSTWPKSREVIARDLGSLPAADREKLISRNVAELHKLDIPEPIAV